MTILATLIAVAAWCGQPNVREWPATKVDQCRQELWDCLQKHPRSTACFLDEKLDK